MIESLLHFRIETNADGSPAILGRGAMGVTYRGFDTSLHRSVAIKVIANHLTSEPDIRDRFFREARAAAKIRHPNIASPDFLGEDESGTVFYTMPLIEGETLQQRIARGPLQVDEVLSLTRRGLRPSEI